MGIRMVESNTWKKNLSEQSIENNSDISSSNNKLWTCNSINNRKTTFEEVNLVRVVIS